MIEKNGNLWDFHPDNWVVITTNGFIKKNGESFIAGPGTGYLFESNEHHGAEVLEEAEAIDCFNPMRPEYADS